MPCTPTCRGLVEIYKWCKDALYTHVSGAGRDLVVGSLATTTATDNLNGLMSFPVEVAMKAQLGSIKLFNNDLLHNDLLHN